MRWASARFACAVFGSDMGRRDKPDGDRWGATAIRLQRQGEQGVDLLAVEHDDALAELQRSVIVEDAVVVLTGGKQHGIARLGDADHEDAGLGRRQRQMDALPVTELAYHQHVGRLAKRRPKRASEGRRVQPDLPLRDEGAIRLVPVL